MAIGVMKLLKGLSLLALGVGLLSLLHGDAAQTIRHWIEYVRVDPHDRLINHFLAEVAGVSHRTLRRLGVGTLLYSAVFCTEGVGLLMAKHWAEYMTAGVTTSFLPIEAYELIVHPSLVKALLIAINVGVVVYLVQEIRKERALRAAAPSSPELARERATAKDAQLPRLPTR